MNPNATTKIEALTTQHNIHHLIFSSTPAVCDAPDHSNPIKEDDPKYPISPYGSSRLICEGVGRSAVVAVEEGRSAVDAVFLSAAVTLIKSAISLGSRSL